VDVVRGLAESGSAIILLSEFPQPWTSRHDSTTSAGEATAQRRDKLAPRVPTTSHAVLKFGIPDPAEIIPAIAPSQTRCVCGNAANTTATSCFGTPPSFERH
jgi:hypothetical protein